MKSGIYEIVNTVNGKRYVGSSVDVWGRKYQHFAKLRSNSHHCSHLQLAWNRYGTLSFEFRVLEECSIELLNDREELWQECCPFELYTKRVISCSNRGCKRSEEVRRQMSIKQKIRFSNLEERNKVSVTQKIVWQDEELRNKVSNVRRGMVFSEEHKNHISIAMCQFRRNN